MLTYSPGTWYAVATPRAVAVLAADVQPDTLHQVWAAMQTGDGLAAVLEGMVGSFGVSLSSLPPFAVASHLPDEHTLRVVVRGGITVTVSTQSGDTVKVDGLNVPTWTDRVIDAPCEIRMAQGQASTKTLPLLDGVVQADAVCWKLSVRASAPAATADPRLSRPAPLPVDDVDADRPATPPPSVVPAEPAEPAEPEEPAASTEETLSFDAEVTASTAGAAASADETHAYDDFIFGETRMATVEDAAVRDVEESGLIHAVPHVPGPQVPPVPAAPPVEGDHDGETMTAEQFAALRARLDFHGQAAIADVDTPVAVPVASPVLVVSTGQRCVLDRAAVIGRRPRILHATGTVPNLVTVTSPQQDISRNHVEVRVEGGDILAVDLDTMNGTRLLRVGQDPVRLDPGAPTLLVGGDRLDLGDGIMLSFEGL